MSDDKLTSEEQDVIESTAIDASLKDEDLEQSQQNEQDLQKPETVVVKKGGFLIFLIFLLSVAALGISAFLYYQQYILDRQNSDEPQWQQPLTDLDADITQQVSSLTQQLNALKASNQQVLAELSSLKTAQQSLTAQKMPQAIKTTAYDDTDIKQQIAAIKRQFTTIEESSANQLVYDDSTVQQKLQALEIQLNEESRKLVELQNVFKVSQAQQQKKIQQLVSDTQQKQSHISLQPDTVSNIHTHDLIKSTLKAAHIQLNINGNIEQTLNLLAAAQQQLQDNGGQAFKDFNNQLLASIKQIEQVSVVDDVAVHKQINNLEDLTEKLAFTGQKQEPTVKESSSWLDKLITVRKVGDDNNALITATEKNNIRNQITAHYGLMNNALINKNQSLWSSQIEQIIGVLQQYFAEDSGQIEQQLLQLKAVTLHPVFPDLSDLIKRFNSIDFEQSGE